MTDLKGKVSRFHKRLSTMHKQSRRNWFSLIYHILRLKFTRGFYFVEIHDNELDMRGRGYEDSFLNWREQQKYLAVLNPRKYYSVARNKWLTHIVLETVGVKDRARLLCYSNPELGEGNENVARNRQQVLQMLGQSGLNSFIVKTTESSHGDNVWVIKDMERQGDDALLTRFDNRQVRLSELLGEEPLIFESLIKQSRQFGELNATSVNTIRFMTTLMPDGTAKVIAAFFKIGRAGKCVDNAGSGGNVDAGIDIETGQLINPIIFNTHRNTKPAEFHPDSGVSLKNFKIENWEAIKRKVEEFQQRLTFVKAAGWDIAITDNGPKVIEVNDMWDRIGQMFIGRGWKKEIETCYLAWKEYYSNKK